jgi:hypothetical protein
MELTLADRNQAHLLVIFRTPGQGETEATPGLTLLRTALAGQGGMLFRELRDTRAWATRSRPCSGSRPRPASLPSTSAPRRTGWTRPWTVPGDRRAAAPAPPCLRRSCSGPRTCWRGITSGRTRVCSRAAAKRPLSCQGAGQGIQPRAHRAGRRAHPGRGPGHRPGVPAWDEAYVMKVAP